MGAPGLFAFLSATSSSYHRVNNHWSLYIVPCSDINQFSYQSTASRGHVLVVRRGTGIGWTGVGLVSPPPVDNCASRASVRTLPFPTTFFLAQPLTSDLFPHTPFQLYLRSLMSHQSIFGTGSPISLSSQSSRGHSYPTLLA